MLETVRRFDGLTWAFTHNDLGQPGSAGHFYRPLWVLWNEGVSRLSSDSPVAFHAGNLVLYGVITIEVWLLIRGLLGTLPAAVGAIAFALYPRHTESVAWISGNTDLVATVLALGAVLTMLARAPTWLRTPGAAALAAGAALAKEAAFVLPLLGLVLFALERRRDRVAARRLVPPLVAVVAGQLGVLVIRTVVLEGLGGYAAYPWTPVRVAGALATYLAAALSPPQLELLRHVYLLVVPAVLLVLSVLAAVALHRRRLRWELEVLAAGDAWFLLALLPTLNLAVDLNNANGERLLFLPSVGLAIALAAVVPLFDSRLGLVVSVAAGVIVLLVTLQAASTWIRAGDIADRLLAQTLRLGPERGTAVLLSVPEAYRNAHVFHGSLDSAVHYRGRRGLAIVLCLPVQVLHERAGSVSFVRQAPGSYRGSTTWDAPFDFPVLRGGNASISRACRYERADGKGGKRWPLGVGLEGQAEPTVPRGARFVYFDGRNLRPFRPR